MFVEESVYTLNVHQLLHFADAVVRKDTIVICIECAVGLGQVKGSKDTSVGPAVSPNTAQSQAPHKRLYGAAK